MSGGKHTGGTSLGGKDQDGPGRKSEGFQTQDGHGVMKFSSSEGSHPRSSNYRVCDGGCSHTHLLHTHFSAHGACIICLRTSAHVHACAHTRMAQGREQGLLHAHVVSLHLIHFCCP